jgi:hypothetical protein
VLPFARVRSLLRFEAGHIAQRSYSLGFSDML